MKKRRLARFGLKSLLIGVMVVGMVLGLVANILIQHRREMAVVKRITGIDPDVAPVVAAVTVPTPLDSPTPVSIAISNYVGMAASGGWKLSKVGNRTTYMKRD